MKSLLFILLTFFAFNTGISQTKTVFETRMINKLIIKNIQLDSLLKDYISKNKFEFRTKHSCILLNSYNKPEGLELKLISVEEDYFLKTVFPSLYSEYALIGYSEIDNNIIFVFNVDLLKFFSKTEENNGFNFCVRLPKVKPTPKKKIPPPPLNFEPCIYTYKYIKDKFILIDCSMVGYF